MQASPLEVETFKPIEIVRADDEEPIHIIRTPSPLKMMISFDGQIEVKCETKYYDTGIKKPREEKMLKDGKMHGIYKRWHDNGLLCEESVYNDGKLHGKQIYYSIHGTVMHEFNFVDGQMHGTQIAYYFNGRIMSRIQYKNGLLFGEKTEYHKCGTLKSLETYNDNGLLVGTARSWHSNGRLSRDTTYIDGKLHGMYFEYNPQDLPIRAIYFEHGVVKAMCV
jgi:antitoxin component YwqK of YwqJK toxin-antitoxin module